CPLYGASRRGLSRTLSMRARRSRTNCATATRSPGGKPPAPRFSVSKPPPAPPAPPPASPGLSSIGGPAADITADTGGSSDPEQGPCPGGALADSNTARRHCPFRVKASSSVPQCALQASAPDGRSCGVLLPREVEC